MFTRTVDGHGAVQTLEAKLIRFAVWGIFYLGVLVIEWLIYFIVRRSKHQIPVYWEVAENEKSEFVGTETLNLVVRLMRIIEVKEDKKQYLDLLLLADEQENMIDRYLDKGKMYVLDDNGIKCECIVTDEGNDVLEIKNIATVPDYQGKGYAKSLIDFIVEKYREQYAILQVGTGDSPLTIPFYEKCGFVRSHIIPNFFTDNYDHPIYEDGVQLVDMVYLQRQL